MYFFNNTVFLLSSHFCPIQLNLLQPTSVIHSQISSPILLREEWEKNCVLLIFLSGYATTRKVVWSVINFSVHHYFSHEKELKTTWVFWFVILMLTKESWFSSKYSRRLSVIAHHSVLEWLRLTWPSESTPLLKHWHPDQFDKKHVLLALEDLQGGVTTYLGNLFQFVPIVSCPATEHYWKELISVFFASYIQPYMDTLFLSILFARLQSPSSPTFSVYRRCFILLMILVVLHWILSSISRP